MSARRLLFAAAWVAATGGAVSAQGGRVVVPVGAIAGPAAAGPAAVADEQGVAVEMFENPNLDRFLRAAQNFLARENYDGAIQVLQDIVEGRSVEVVGGEDPPKPAEAVPPAPPAPSERQVAVDMRSGGALPPKPAKPLAPLDANQSVFSQDGRLYRPVRRLCHELLARLPAVGIQLYRTSYEVAAGEMLEEALREGSVAALERVANRYFITLPAGRAMVVLADRLMHEGRYRAAVQVLRDLVELYPAENRERLKISVVWCRFKIALCMRLAGELGAAHEAVKALAAEHPEESLRILGELQAVKDLPQSSMFANEMVELLAQPRAVPSAAWLAADTEALVPVWQYRFANAEPYKDPKPSNNEGSRFFIGEGMVTAMMPYAGRYGPGTWVAFSPGAGAAARPQALFLEHYRLRVADAASGVVYAEGDGVDAPPVPREGHPRVRIASSDYALLRPVEDEQRRYVVHGHRGNTAVSTETLKASDLIAYDRVTTRQVWSSLSWREGSRGLADVTFLAAPTLFGERLLLPALRGTAYTLECLDRSTGRPLWSVPLHGGGSPFFKAPGAPVVVQSGIAYVSTNAGCLAAVDAFAGELRWIRRYERGDPIRKIARKRSTREQFPQGYMQFLQGDLAGFLPNDLVVGNGVVIHAPCDGDLVLCLDGATGQIVWLVDGTTHYAPYGKLRALVGVAAGALFFVSDTSLVCIELDGGLVRWHRELPTWNGPKGSVRGRGCIAGDYVVVPGERELLVFDAHGKQTMRRLPLPEFDPSHEPLSGSCYVVSNGPWLALGYQGGVEVFSSTAALRQLAAGAGDASEKATFLVQAGDPDAAEQLLHDELRRADLAAERRTALARHLLDLSREHASRLAHGGDLAGALALLDRVLPLVPERALRLDWHLARVEICKESGDLLAHEREQQRLYDCMEGKG